MNIIFWFTRDLRLDDNVGLYKALKDASKTDDKRHVLMLYILDETDPWPVQGASAWWLNHSLQNLSNTIEKCGGTLLLRKGDPIKEIKKVAKDYNAEALYFSRAYEPHSISLEKQLKEWGDQKKIECKRFPGTLLFEPEAIKNLQGDYYKVFTPFYKQGLRQESRKPKALKNIKLMPNTVKSLSLKKLGLLPTNPNWAKSFDERWPSQGEQAANEQLSQAIKDTIESYADNRDTPSIDGTSRLSPYLHFGEISAARVWETVNSQMTFEDAETFLRQLFWRDFNTHLLFNEPHIDKKAFKPKFDTFPWRKSKTDLTKWQKGLTGYPIVDAGMRQLWRTGWMHNRVRMIVASFLTKHLRIHWLEGANWFWDTLLDADLANNSGGWQWVAGCGADASPYFRVFNPILQGEKFDKQGHYIREWVPELNHLPDKYIHSPWQAPKSVLEEASVVLGTHYPKPMVDHKEAREAALAAYKNL